MAQLRLAAPASADIADLLDWSFANFGPAGRRRYESLIVAALQDVARDGHPPGAQSRPELGRGILVYHLRHSRRRSQGIDGIVRSPRHFIVYRLRTPDLVTVLRVLHDAMDLARHLEAAGGDP
jgi:toxin ParE1/3/4